MKHVIFILFFIRFFLPGDCYSQIERVIVETYYISDQFDSTDVEGGKLEMGSVTYRIYVDLKPGNRLLSLYGDTNHILKISSTKSFFNNLDGQTYGKDIKKGLYNQNTVALDTWLTIGQAVTKTADGKANFGVLKTQDSNGSFIGGSNNASGLLTNSVAALGIPLTTSDGMVALPIPNYTWTAFGIQDYLTGIDSSMFGSFGTKSNFSSRNMHLSNSPGVMGVNPDSNQVLLAQLTTKGKLEFELNLVVLLDGATDTVRYVANDDTLVVKKKEKKSSYLKYPFPKAVCGCKDPAYLEYNVNFECASTDSCKNLIVFGCRDTMACNYDPKANFAVKSLCCYPGSCGGRDLSVVCPSVKGTSLEADIYPNPTTGILFLNITTGVGREMNYEVYNCFGTRVLNERLGVKERIINHEIDLNSLPDGFYLIRINVGGDYISKQFFKNSK